MKIGNDIKQSMMASGAREYPNEACGFIVKRGKKSVVVDALNTSAFPSVQFLISAEDFAKAADMGEVIGVWHTHCDIPPTPSDADRAACESLEMPWYIMSVSNIASEEFVFSEIVAVEPNGFQMGYLERPYIFGVFDCYSLVCDYYQREYSIKLGSYPHIEDWWKKGHDFFAESYKQEGFVSLVDQDVQVGDIFLIQTDGNVANHVAIYIGNDMVLHQLHGRLSRRDVYAGFWKKHTIGHLRHKTKC